MVIELVGYYGKRLTFAITGSKKRGDEGAPLFTVRVDGVVRNHSLFDPTDHE